MIERSIVKELLLSISRMNPVTWLRIALIVPVLEGFIPGNKVKAVAS